MIITLNLATILAAPSLFISTYVVLNDPQEKARIAYNNCLVDAHNEAIELKKTVRQFETDIKASCLSERKTYYDIIYKSEQDFGSSEAESVEYAKDECDNVLQYITSSYAAYLDEGVSLEKSSI